MSKRYLIEVPHDDHKVECIRVVKIFLNSGSHFLRNAEWGCRDGDHKAWMILDLENKDEARQILPPAFRSQAKIVEISKFTLEEMDEILLGHDI
ncbi:MAG: hypothetical protein JXB48_20420 [Candidatus Latescibacteria bacterium]|nr:hypothetical protein [Candidatus Latescibacterota bacterium]